MPSRFDDWRFSWTRSNSCWSPASAGLFVVNAIVAVVEPTDVTGLVDKSLPGRVIPAMNGRWVAWVVAINDMTIGAALLATIWVQRARPLALAWAGAWLFAVALIKLTSLEALGG